MHTRRVFLAGAAAALAPLPVGGRSRHGVRGGLAAEVADGGGRGLDRDVRCAGAVQLRRLLRHRAPDRSGRAGGRFHLRRRGVDGLAGGPGGLVLSTRRRLLSNELVLIAPAGSRTALKIAPGMALGRALGSRRLAVADTTAVPAGKYARTALTRLGVWDQVEDRLLPGENVRTALAYVSRGEAPLGIVYATDARAEPRVRVVGVFPVQPSADRLSRGGDGHLPQQRRGGVSRLPAGAPGLGDLQALRLRGAGASGLMRPRRAEGGPIPPDRTARESFRSLYSPRFCRNAPGATTTSPHPLNRPHTLTIPPHGEGVSPRRSGTATRWSSSGKPARRQSVKAPSSPAWNQRGTQAQRPLAGRATGERGWLRSGDGVAATRPPEADAAKALRALPTGGHRTTDFAERDGLGLLSPSTQPQPPLRPKRSAPSPPVTGSCP